MSNERADGRTNSCLQKIFVQKNVSGNSTSSIYIETTHLKILCSVDGPIFLTGMQSKKNQDLNSLILDVNIKFPSYLGKNSLVKNYIIEKSNIENYIENLFKNVILIERYSRNKIVINLDIIEINCDLTPYAIMGISLALNEANIEQKGICTVANIIKKNNEIIIDPTLEEESSAEFKLIWGCLFDLEENTLFVQKGHIDEESLKKAVATSLKICETYHKFMITNFSK